MHGKSGSAASRIRRTVAERVRDALTALAEGQGMVVRQSERAWASVTFEGARHTVELAFDGNQAVEAGECFIAELPEHEFSIPGQLVAEAIVTGADQVLTPLPRLAVTCELLLLRDA